MSIAPQAPSAARPPVDVAVDVTLAILVVLQLLRTLPTVARHAVQGRPAASHPIGAPR